MEQQQNRATAFKFYEVYSWKRGKERRAKNFVCGDSTPSTFVQRKLDCGTMYKSDAWRIYLECFASLGQDMNVLPCGLVVNVTNRWLGCSKLLFPNKLVLESPNVRMIKETVTSWMWHRPIKIFTSKL